MKRRRGSVFFGTLLMVVAVLALGGVSSAAAAKITAAYPNWSPENATIDAGESVDSKTPKRSRTASASKRPRRHPAAQASRAAPPRGEPGPARAPSLSPGDYPFVSLFTPP